MLILRTVGAIKTQFTAARVVYETKNHTKNETIKNIKKRFNVKVI